MPERQPGRVAGQLEGRVCALGRAQATACRGSAAAVLNRISGDQTERLRKCGSVAPSGGGEHFAPDPFGGDCQ